MDVVSFTHTSVSESFPNTSYVGQGDGNSRWIHHLDGTVSLEPKSPAYVVGERILRPLIDGTFHYSHQLLNVVKGGLKFIDQRLSKLLTPFPFVSADRTMPDVVEVDVSTQQDHLAVQHLKSTKVLVAVGINPNNANLFIEKLSPADKVAIAEDSTLVTNYQKFHKIFLDLANFISEKGAKYKAYQENLIDACKSLRYIESHLDNILSDIQSNGENSKFSPLSKNIYVLTFPKYSKDFKTKKTKENLYQIERFYVASAKKHIIPPELTSEEIEKINNECHDNPIEAALLTHLGNIGGLLNTFNIQQTYNFEQFKTLFGNKTIEILENHISLLKENLIQGVDTGNKIVARYTHSLEVTIYDRIYTKIHQIYQEHGKIIASTSGKRLNVKKQTQTGLVMSWDVENIGYTYNTLSFRFRVGVIGSEHDEL